MRPQIRSSLSFANVTSMLALTVALGGTSYAVSQVGKGQIKHRHIADGAVRDKHIHGGIDPVKFGGFVNIAKTADYVKPRVVAHAAAAPKYIGFNGELVVGGDEYSTEQVSARCGDDADEGTDYVIREWRPDSPPFQLHIAGPQNEDGDDYWDRSSVQTVIEQGEEDDPKQVTVSVRVKRSGGSAWLHVHCVDLNQKG